MSDILIRGMEMPTYEQGDLVLRVRWDGRVDKDYSGNTVATAVPVPPHGRLIDADKLIDRVIAKYLEHERKNELVFTAAEIKQDICDLIADAPTIIPASEEGEK